MPSALLDVNALVALAWDSHVHHAAVRAWFAAHSGDGWATCPLTESGFVRVSANPKILAFPVSVTAAQSVLTGIRSAPGHSFLTDDVSIVGVAPPRRARPDFTNPVADSDVPDPMVIEGGEGSWCVFATNGNGANVQTMRSTDLICYLYWKNDGNTRPAPSTRPITPSAWPRPTARPVRSPSSPTRSW